MCQLTLVNSGKASWNKTLLYLFLTENSRFTNKDGTGVFNVKGGLYKTELAASLITNLGRIINQLMVDNTPIMGHVRNASQINKNLLDDIHAHPFMSEHYVFEHNGSLTFKDAKRDEEYKGMELIDSQIFLAELEKRYTGNVYTDLVETMKDFNGKFAFMIYHIPAAEYFVARGRTADLHKCQVTIDSVPGIVINTDNKTGEEALLKATNLLQLHGTSAEYAPKMSLIAAESVYRLNGIELEFLGKIEETTRVVPATENFTATGRTTVNGVPYAQNTARNVEPLTRRPNVNSKPEDYFLWFIRNTAITIGDLEEIGYRVLGKKMLEMSSWDKDSLVLVLEELYKAWNKPKREIWDKMRHMCYSPTLVYKGYKDLQFPYWLTPLETFKDIYQAMKDAAEKAEAERKAKEEVKDAQEIVQDSLLENGQSDG